MENSYLITQSAKIVYVDKYKYNVQRNEMLTNVLSIYRIRVRLSKTYVSCHVHQSSDGF